MEMDQEEILRAALETLPDDMRRCFLLHVGQGFEEGEIAILLKIPVERVRACLKQVRDRLPSDGGPRRIS
jgi:DNA-directed RNA polymerase specialized sigma24 family protein